MHHSGSLRGLQALTSLHVTLRWQVLLPSFIWVRGRSVGAVAQLWLSLGWANQPHVCHPTLPPSYPTLTQHSRRPVCRWAGRSWPLSLASAACRTSPWPLVGWCVAAGEAPIKKSRSWLDQEQYSPLPGSGCVLLYCPWTAPALPPPGLIPPPSPNASITSLAA